MTDPKAPAKTGYQERLEQIVTGLQRELETIMFAVRERGFGRFGRIIGLGLLSIALSYWPLSTARAKVSVFDRQIDAAKATAAYADRYKTVKQQLDSVLAALPAQNDRNGWVISRIRETLNAENLVSNSIDPPEEQAVNGFALQTVHFTMTARFPQLVAWLNRIDSGQNAVQVTSLTLEKVGGRDEDIGLLKVSCAVSTVMPPQRLVP